jgi:hypothetical protein
MKTAELIGAALDWAVAHCDGVGTKWFDSGHLTINGEIYSPSTDWAQAGPIIEREGIELLCESLGFRWVAMPQKGPEWRGPTPLVAAMRCYVASKLGETVKVPSELPGA